MTEHKTTLGQWNADRYDWARADTEAMDGDSAFRCIMELRARVEALELWRATTATASADNSRISRQPWAAMSYRGVMLLPPIDCADPDLWIAERIYEMGFADGQDATTSERARDAEALEAARRAALSGPDPAPTVRFLTVQDCNDMPKHGENFIAEDRPGEITLDGHFTREDLIEIANTVPSTEA